MLGFFISLFLFFNVIPFSNADDLKPWTISVIAYSHGPVGEFRELESVATFVARETAKGFLNRTLVSRDAFHYGATFCLLVDHRVDSAEKQRQRILVELKKFHETQDGKISFEISNPSDCLAN